jgi:8-oxo-dGTP pyrophosphatase MutT (NUDIX family)
MENRGPWKIKSSTSKYQNDFLTLVEDQVIQPDGKPGTYATVQIKPGVSVLPLDDEKNVYLTRQFRYALARPSIEAVSGGLDEQEQPLAAAQREACEELGLEAEDWLDLGQIEEDTSLVRSRGYLFLARGLKFTRSQPDGTEQIERLKMPLDETVRKVMESEIVHSPSALLILKAALYLASAEAAKQSEK